MQLDQINADPTPDRRYRRRVCLTAAIGLCFALALTSEAWARSSGGRYGGRRDSPSRVEGLMAGGAVHSTMPSRPFSGRGSLGYPVPRPSPVYPLPIPISVPSPGFGPSLYSPTPLGGGVVSGGGGGLGGIFGFLLILGVVVFVGKVLLQHLSNTRRNHAGQPSAGYQDGERYAVVTCQLALLAIARALQRDLQHYAETAMTNTVVGLASALQEATMALRRYHEYWRYGTVHVQRVGTLDEAERGFNQAISQERAKLSEELTTNIEGVRRHTPRRERPTADEVGQYLVVTLIVATGYPKFTAFQTPSLNDMEDTLQRLGTLLAVDLLALEVIWSPEHPDDALTEDELLVEYPELSGLSHTIRMMRSCGILEGRTTMTPWLLGWMFLWLVVGQGVPAMAAEVSVAPVEPRFFVPALTWAGILSSIVYGLLGLILLLIGYYVYELITPWSVKEELTTHRNPAVAMVVAAFILGMAVVIAAAIL